MTAVRRLVVDVLKPHDPSLLEFTRRVSEVETVEGASSTLIEHDKEVQNVEITFEGADLDYDAIEAAIDNLSGSVHSIDEVACGEYIVEDSERPRDG